MLKIIDSLIRRYEVSENYTLAKKFLFDKSEMA